jgi:hypothetical protein
MVPALGLPGRFALGTALATSAFVGSYVRRAYAACVGSLGTYVCSAANVTTQTLTGTPLTVTTLPGFSINTAAGNAFSLTGTNGLTFTDNNGSTISGAVAGISGQNSGTGALSITTTGAVTGATTFGIYGLNTGTDLTINAVGVTAGQYGVVGQNAGSGAISITTTGTISGGIFGVVGNNAASATDITIQTVNAIGGAAGILSINDGTGALTIISTGTATGDTYEGITARNLGTNLTIQANNASGTTGIAAAQLGSGPLSITVTGAINGNGAGIYARNAGTSTTSVSVGSGATVTGGTVGVNLVSSTSRPANVVNDGSISGATGIQANGAGSVSIVNVGSITGTGGTAIDLAAATAAATLDMSDGVINGDILLTANQDVVNISAGTVGGAIRAGNGNDALAVTGGAITSIVSGDAGNDDVSISGGVIGSAVVPAGVELGAGADAFAISGGTVFGNVSGEGGADAPAADRFVISGGTITGSVFGLGGGNTFTASGGTVGGSIFAGSQNDTVTVSAAANIRGDPAIGPDAVGLEDGNDLFTMTGGTLGGAVSGGNGNDLISISGGTLASVDAGDGVDTVRISGGAIGGAVDGGSGIDGVFVSGGTIAGGIAAESVTLTGGSVGGDISGLSGLTIDGTVGDPTFRDGVVFSGTGANAVIKDADLAAGGTQFFQGFDSVTVDPSTIRFGTGTNSINLLNLLDGSTLFVNGRAVMTGTLNAVGSTVDMMDGAADDSLTLGGLALNNATIRLDINQQTVQADQIATGAFSSSGTNVIVVNLIGTPSFANQTDVPLVVSTSGIDPTLFTVQGLPGTAGSLFIYQLVPGAGGGLVLRATPVGFAMAVAPQPVVNVGTVDTALVAISGVTTDAVASDLGLAVGSQGAQVSPTVGVFASGQLAHTEHGGFSATSETFNGSGPSFGVDEFSAAISIDFNAAKQWQLDTQYGLNLGLFGGYASTDVTLDPFQGFSYPGDSTNKSGMFGGYGLFRRGVDYVLVSGTAFLGNTDVVDGVLNSTGSYDTQGYAFTGSAGHIFALGDRTRFDLRAGVLGVTFTGDDFVDSSGNRFGESRISFGAVKFEPGIYADFPLENGMTLSPYARADLQQRFSYSNTAEIDGREVHFDDADFSAAVSTGFNLKMSEMATVSGEIRGKFSSDSSTVAAKLGVKIAF